MEIVLWNRTKKGEFNRFASAVIARDPEIMDGEENKIRPHRNCRESMQDRGWIQLILQANILGVVYSYYLGPIFYSLQKL